MELLLYIFFNHIKNNHLSPRSCCAHIMNNSIDKICPFPGEVGVGAGGWYVISCKIIVFLWKANCLARCGSAAQCDMSKKQIVICGGPTHMHYVKCSQCGQVMEISGLRCGQVVSGVFCFKCMKFEEIFKRARKP